MSRLTDIKTKKSISCNLEVFRVYEKDYPVEVTVELKGGKFMRQPTDPLGYIVDTTLEFSWEPLGERFIIIHSSDPNLGAGPVPGVTIKTEVGIYGHDNAKGDFKLLSKTLSDDFLSSD